MTVENKYTGDKACFEYYNTGNPESNGKMIKKRLSDCAYKLGCEVDELIITKQTLLIN